jgi:nitroimidazol reductase NimA-like FMN-containing flavoprotein (pyridoxamine 5'-phosphate oxidase superfamily)
MPPGSSALLVSTVPGARWSVMESDRNGMVVLSREECLRRLGRTGIGRIAVTVGALPAVFPVNYATREGDVYFRTAAGTKMAAAVRHAVVAFEVDDLDRFAHTGWSVLVSGPAEVVEDLERLDGLRHLPLARWVDGLPDTLVRVRSDLVSGRAIDRTAARAAECNEGLPLSSCPDCGCDSLSAVSDGELTSFVCTACFACWHIELGRVHRIPPSTCPGCRLADVCRTAQARRP